MADAGRKDIGDKIAAAVKPDSEKSTTEHLGDSITGKADNAISKGEPNEDKSLLQKIGDTVTGK